MATTPEPDWEKDKQTVEAVVACALDSRNMTIAQLKEEIGELERNILSLSRTIGYQSSERVRDEDRLTALRKAGQALSKAAYDVTDGRDGELQCAIEVWEAADANL